jgi:uncharacterized membrane protein YraQ (UPF0718 family)
MEDIMKKKLPNFIIKNEYRVGFVLLLLSGILFIISPGRVLTALEENFNIALRIIFYAVIAVLISVAVHFLVPVDFAVRYLSQNRVRYSFYATILGILTPGPIYAIYPIVYSLKNKGIHNYILVSYITGQTIMGPARAPFEIGLLGTTFFVYRIVLGIIMGILAGVLYFFVSKRFPDNKK